MENNERKTLAKRLKIRNLKRQSNFIFGKLESFLENPTESGDVIFIYRGFIYPEVKKELEEAGFEVISLKPATAIGYFNSTQVNLIIISDDVFLTDEELLESEKYAQAYEDSEKEKRLYKSSKRDNHPSKSTDTASYSGHSPSYSSKPRFRDYAEYQAAQSKSSDENNSSDDSEVTGDYMKRLVDDLNAMRSSDAQDSGIALENEFTGGIASIDENTSPSFNNSSSSNSIPSVEPPTYDKKFSGGGNETTSKLSPSQKKRARRDQIRQKKKH